jgi:hypothetical protein
MVAFVRAMLPALGSHWRAALCGAGPGRGVEEHPALDPAPAQLDTKRESKLMPTTQGKFVWYDLMTSDSKAAESFYRSVIGWDAKDSGMADRSYTLFPPGR